MSSILSKITLHAKNLENLKLNEKRQPTDTNTEKAQMLESPNWDF